MFDRLGGLHRFLWFIPYTHHAHNATISSTTPSTLSYGFSTEYPLSLTNPVALLLVLSIGVAVYATLSWLLLHWDSNSSPWPHWLQSLWLWHPYSQRYLTSKSQLASLQTSTKRKHAQYYGGTRNGKPHGHGRLEFPDASWYDGEFYRGKFHGLGLMRYQIHNPKTDPLGLNLYEEPDIEQDNIHAELFKSYEDSNLASATSDTLSDLVHDTQETMTETQSNQASIESASTDSLHTSTDGSLTASTTSWSSNTICSNTSSTRPTSVSSVSSIPLLTPVLAATLGTELKGNLVQQHQQIQDIHRRLYNQKQQISDLMQTSNPTSTLKLSTIPKASTNSASLAIKPSSLVSRSKRTAKRERTRQQSQSASDRGSTPPLLPPKELHPDLAALPPKARSVLAALAKCTVTCIGKFENGVRHGPASIIFKFSNGVREDYCKGVRFQGTFNQGVLEGQGTLLIDQFDELCATDTQPLVESDNTSDLSTPYSKWWISRARAVPSADHGSRTSNSNSYNYLKGNTGVDPRPREALDLSEINSATLLKRRTMRGTGVSRGISQDDLGQSYARRGKMFASINEWGSNGDSEDEFYEEQDFVQDGAYHETCLVDNEGLDLSTPTPEKPICLSSCTRSDLQSAMKLVGFRGYWRAGELVTGIPLDPVSISSAPDARTRAKLPDTNTKVQALIEEESSSILAKDERSVSQQEFQPSNVCHIPLAHTDESTHAAIVEPEHDSTCSFSVALTDLVSSGSTFEVQHVAGVDTDKHAALATHVPNQAHSDALDTPASKPRKGRLPRKRSKAGPEGKLSNVQEDTEQPSPGLCTSLASTPQPVSLLPSNDCDESPCPSVLGATVVISSDLKGEDFSQLTSHSHYRDTCDSDDDLVLEAVNSRSGTTSSVEKSKILLPHDTLNAGTATRLKVAKTPQPFESPLPVLPASISADQDESESHVGDSKAVATMLKTHYSPHDSQDKAQPSNPITLTPKSGFVFRPVIKTHPDAYLSSPPLQPVDVDTTCPVLHPQHEQRQVLPSAHFQPPQLLSSQDAQLSTHSDVQVCKGLLDAVESSGKELTLSPGDQLRVPKRSLTPPNGNTPTTLPLPGLSVKPDLAGTQPSAFDSNKSLTPAECTQNCTHELLQQTPLTTASGATNTEVQPRATVFEEKVNGCDIDTAASASCELKSSGGVQMGGSAHFSNGHPMHQQFAMQSYSHQGVAGWQLQTQQQPGSFHQPRSGRSTPLPHAQTQAQAHAQAQVHANAQAHANLQAHAHMQIHSYTQADLHLRRYPMLVPQSQFQNQSFYADQRQQQHSQQYHLQLQMLQMPQVQFHAHYNQQAAPNSLHFSQSLPQGAAPTAAIPQRTYSSPGQGVRAQSASLVPHQHHYTLQQHAQQQQHPPQLQGMTYSVLPVHGIAMGNHVSFATQMSSTSVSQPHLGAGPHSLPVQVPTGAGAPLSQAMSNAPNASMTMPLSLSLLPQVNLANSQFNGGANGAFLHPSQPHLAGERKKTRSRSVQPTTVARSTPTSSSEAASTERAFAKISLTPWETDTIFAYSDRITKSIRNILLSSSCVPRPSSSGSGPNLLSLVLSQIQWEGQSVHMPVKPQQTLTSIIAYPHIPSLERELRSLVSQSHDHNTRVVDCRSRAAASIRLIARKLWPNAEVVAHGSATNDTALSGSDLDLVIILSRQGRLPIKDEVCPATSPATPPISFTQTRLPGARVSLQTSLDSLSSESIGSLSHREAIATLATALRQDALQGESATEEGGGTDRWISELSVITSAAVPVIRIRGQLAAEHCSSGSFEFKGDVTIVSDPSKLMRFGGQLPQLFQGLRPVDDDMTALQIEYLTNDASISRLDRSSAERDTESVPRLANIISTAPALQPSTPSTGKNSSSGIAGMSNSPVLPNQGGALLTNCWNAGPLATQLCHDIKRNLPGSLELCLVIKHILQAFELSSSYSGGLSSYCVLVMSAAYIRSLHTLVNHELSSSPIPLDTLVLGFLEFYGSYFDANTLIVALQSPTGYLAHAHSTSRSSLLQAFPRVLSILDPLDLHNNLALSCFQFIRIQAIFRSIVKALTAPSVLVHSSTSKDHTQVPTSSSLLSLSQVLESLSCSMIDHEMKSRKPPSVE